MSHLGGSHRLDHFLLQRFGLDDFILGQGFYLGLFLEPSLRLFYLCPALEDISLQ